MMGRNIKAKDTLPNKLSDLIDVGINDLIRVERSKNYEVDMGTWYDSHSEADVPCVVCFAGGVMAKSLDLEGVSADACLAPDYFSSSIENKLLALDAARYGEATAAYAQMKGKLTDQLSIRIWNRLETIEPRRITEYATDPRAFRRQMRLFAKHIRAAGF